MARSVEFTILFVGPTENLQVVSSIENAPEILAQVQEVILPIITFTLENKLLGKYIHHRQSNHCFDRFIELLSNMYDLVDSLTFRMRTISPNMWPVLGLTYELFKSEAIDFLDGKCCVPRSISIFSLRLHLPPEMLPSLDNFLSFGSEVIQNRADYKQMLVDIYTTAMTSSQLGENDRVDGSKLAESLLLNLRGSLDEVRSMRFGSATDCH